MYKYFRIPQTSEIQSPADGNYLYKECSACLLTQCHLSLVLYARYQELKSRIHIVYGTEYVTRSLYFFMNHVHCHVSVISEEFDVAILEQFYWQ